MLTNNVCVIVEVCLRNGIDMSKNVIGLEGEEVDMKDLTEEVNVSARFQRVNCSFAGSWGGEGILGRKEQHGQKLRDVKWCTVVWGNGL